PELRSVVLAEPRIYLHVVDNDRLAAPESLAQRARHRDSQGHADERLGAAGVLAANDVLVASGFRIADAGRAEVLAQKPCGSFLTGRRIAQRTDRVVKPETKRHPLFFRA